MKTNLTELTDHQLWVLQRYLGRQDWADSEIKDLTNRKCCYEEIVEIVSIDLASQFGIDCGLGCEGCQRDHHDSQLVKAFADWIDEWKKDDGACSDHLQEYDNKYIMPAIQLWVRERISRY